MPDIGSYVIYGANGICTVKDKRQEKLSGTKNEYYILSPSAAVILQFMFLPITVSLLQK